MENTLIHMLGRKNNNFLPAITQSCIIYHELSATDMNETLNTVPDDNVHTDKKIYNELSDCCNESLYIPIAPTLFEESAIPMIADEDAVDHIPKNPPPCGRSHVCAHGAAANTSSCTEWSSSYLYWRSLEKEK